MRLNRLEFALMNNPMRSWSQRWLETPLMIGRPGALRELRVLEMGCGRGVGVEILLERMKAAQIVAFDIDPAMVKLAKERTGRFRRQVHLFVQCLDGAKYAGVVAQETDAGKAMGIRATPTFLVNGQLIQGALPVVQFQEVIDEKRRNTGP